MIERLETLADAFNEKYCKANDAARLHEKDGWRNEGDWQRGYAAAYYEATLEIRKLAKGLRGEGCTCSDQSAGYRDGVPWCLNCSSPLLWHNAKGDLSAVAD